jgi:hypothetical protein
MPVWPSYHATARREHGDVDARLRVDVEHAHRGLAVLRLDQALLDGERRHARQHVAAVGPRVHRLLAHADLREQVVDVAFGCSERETMATLLVSVLPPPTPSTCSRSEAPMAPISASSRARSSAGSQSRRKKGPREVPARIRTQGRRMEGMGRMMAITSMHVNCIVAM